MRDILEAEYSLFGEGSRNLSLRCSPGGADRLNDLAQAWLDGDKERVLDFVRTREEKIRERIAVVNLSAERLRGQILRLREQGWKTQRIARRLGLTISEVRAIRRVATRTARKADEAEIVRLKTQGLTGDAIATACGLSRRQVVRVLSRHRARQRERESPGSATN